MKDSILAKSIFVVLILFAAGFACIGHCQEKQYNFDASFAFTANQFRFEKDNPTEYLNGYQAEVGARVAGNKTRLTGLLNVERKLNVTQLDPMTYPIMLPSSVMGFSVVQRDTTSFGLGARLSHQYGAFEPFVAAIAGVRFGNDVQPNKFDRRYQAGAKINLNHFFFKVAYQFERVTGNDGVEQGYVLGAGVRF